MPDSVMKITPVNNTNMITAFMELILQWMLLSVADRVSRGCNKMTSKFFTVLCNLFEQYSFQLHLL